MSGSPVCGIVDHHLGALARVLRRDDAAAEHLRAAEEAHARLGASYWLVATRLGRARVLVQRGDEHAAVAHLLTDVLAVAREGGTASWNGRIGAARGVLMRFGVLGPLEMEADDATSWAIPSAGVCWSCSRTGSGRRAR